MDRRRGLRAILKISVSLLLIALPCFTHTAAAQNTFTNATVSLTDPLAAANLSYGSPQPVTITFGTVSTAGTTSLQTRANLIPFPPMAFQAGSPATYYIVTTTAVLADGVRVCIDVRGMSFANPGAIQLFQLVNSDWIALTNQALTPDVQVCGDAPTLGTFAIFYPPVAATAIQVLAGTGYQFNSIDGPGGDPRDDLNDGGLATAAAVSVPNHLAVDRVRNFLYATDQSDVSLIRRIDLVTGTITTVASGSFHSQGPIALDAAGTHLYYLDDAPPGSSGDIVKKLDLVTNTTTIVAGGGPCCGFPQEGLPATQVVLPDIDDLLLDSADNLFIASGTNSRVIRIDGTTGIFRTILWEAVFPVPGILSTTFRDGPRALAFDRSGSLLVGGAVLVRIDPGADGLVNGSSDESFTQIAGIPFANWSTTALPFDGDGGAAMQAHIAMTYGMFVAQDGAVVFGDGLTQKVRRIAPGADGVVNGGPDEIIRAIAGFRHITASVDTGRFSTERWGNYRGVAEHPLSGGVIATDYRGSEIVSWPPSAVSSVLNITSANNTTFTAGVMGSFTVTATGTPSPTFSETGALPNNVTLNSSGLLQGTPTAGTGGIYNLTMIASNGVAPNATQAFTLTVNEAPAITSTNSVTFIAGSLGEFNVTATGMPLPTFSVLGTLPMGVSLDSSGLLQGTPAAGTAGTYHVSITAGNVVGNATQAFTLTVNEAPAVTSANSATFEVGASTTFSVTSTGTPKPVLNVSGTLPAGVSFLPITNNPSAGYLTGIPAVGTSGTYTLTIKASNIVGDALQTFTLKVIAVKSLTVTPINPSLPVGLTLQFNALALYDDGTTRNVTSADTLWSRSNSRVDITDGGLATGLHQGTAVVTATHAGLSASTTVTVGAPVVISLVITPAPATIPTLGQTQQFAAMGTYSDGGIKNLTQNVTWSSTCAGWSKCAGVTITNGGNGGLAIGTTQGTVTILATFVQPGGNIVGAATLFVAPELISLKITPVNPSITGLPAIQFTATGIYSDNSTKDLTKSATWTSSQPAIATISSTTGMAALSGFGNTTIKATVNGLTDATTLTVSRACIEPSIVDIAFSLPPLADGIAFAQPSPYLPPADQSCPAYISAYAPPVVKVISPGGASATYPNFTTNDQTPLNGVAISPTGGFFSTFVNAPSDPTAIPGIAFALPTNLRFTRAEFLTPASTFGGSTPFNDLRFNQGPVGPALDDVTSTADTQVMYFGNWYANGDLVGVSLPTGDVTRLPHGNTPIVFFERITALAFEMRTSLATNPRTKHRFLVAGHGTTVTTIDLDTSALRDVNLATDCPTNIAGVSKADGILSLAVHPKLGNIYVEVKGTNNVTYIVSLDLALNCRPLQAVQLDAGLTSGGIVPTNFSTSEGRIVVTPNLRLFRLGAPQSFTQSYILPDLAAPVADAGPDLRVVNVVNPLVVLDGSASYDPKGGALSYSWMFVSGPVGADPRPTTPGKATLLNLAPGTYIFELTVSDGVESATDQVTVTVVDGRPVANAGPDQIVGPGDLVTLDGSASTGDGLSYLWELVSAASINLSDPTSVKPTFDAPSIAGGTTLTFKLTVSAHGSASIDFVNIQVKSN